jgi:hypothetical protein
MEPIADGTKLRVKKWEVHQTYRADRGQPPWIKLYAALFTDAGWNKLGDLQKCQLMHLWVLASLDCGHVDYTTVSHKAVSLDTPIELDRFIAEGWLIPVSREEYEAAVKADKERGKTRDAPKAKTPPPKEKPKPEEPVKNSYGELGKVKLTNEEHAKLIAANGEADTARMIDILDSYLASKGRQYKSHYATMKRGGWVQKRLAEDKAKGGGDRKSGEIGTRPEDFE